MIERYRVIPHEVEAVRWPAAWERQKHIARRIGELGIVFRFEPAFLVDTAQQELPQLHLYTYRWDRITPRVGDWIVFKGSRRFEVLPDDEFRMEYECPER